MSDRFDLEQAIFQCWNVTDDLQVLLDNWVSLDDDGKQNYLIGLHQMYQLKFQKCFNTFEHCVANRSV